MKTVLFLLLVLCLNCQCTKLPSKDCIGEKIKDCVCTMQYDPVCGCDGKTYSNACVAKCEGIKSYTKGPCP